MRGSPIRRESALRPLLLLLALAAERKDPPGVLEAAGERWGRGKLGRAARAIAAGLREGDSTGRAISPWVPGPVAAAVAAGEARGDLSSGLRRALGILDRRRTGARGARGAVLYPLLVASLALGMLGVTAAAAAPVFEELRAEAAALGAASGPSWVLRAAASSPRAAGSLLLLAALLPWAAFPVLVAAARTRPGARVVLRLPFLGEVARRRAAADFAETFGDHLGAGAGAEVAAAAAARAVSNAALREELLAAAGRIAAGDPVPEAMGRTRLPAWVGEAFEAPHVRADGGVRAAAILARRADEEYRHAVAVASRAAALLAWAAAAGAVGGMAWLAFSPLLGIGGIG